MSFNSIRDAPCVQWLLSFAKWLTDNARPFVVPETSAEMVQWVMSLKPHFRLPSQQTMR
jgi:hypothetical protein